MNSYSKNSVTILLILGGNCDLGNLVVSRQKQLWRSPATNMTTYPWTLATVLLIMVSTMLTVAQIPFSSKEPFLEMNAYSKNRVIILPILGWNCDLGNLVVSGHKQLWRSQAANMTSEWLNKSCGLWLKGYLVASSRKIYMPGLCRVKNGLTIYKTHNGDQIFMHHTYTHARIYT